MSSHAFAPIVPVGFVPLDASANAQIWVNALPLASSAPTVPVSLPLVPTGMWGNVDLGLGDVNASADGAWGQPAPHVSTPIRFREKKSVAVPPALLDGEWDSDSCDDLAADSLESVRQLSGKGSSTEQGSDASSLTPDSQRSAPPSPSMTPDPIVTSIAQQLPKEGKKKKGPTRRGGRRQRRKEGMSFAKLSSMVDKIIDCDEE